MFVMTFVILFLCL